MNASADQPPNTIDIPVDQIPWYRWRWFFIVTFLIFYPATWLVGLTGNIYGKRDNGEIFQLPDRVKNLIMLVPALLIAAKLISLMAQR